MKMEFIYIISQIITILYFLILSFSYLLKDRKKILFLNFIAHIGQTTAMALLNGYTGSCMALIMTIRDLVFLGEEQIKTKDKKTNSKFNFIVFIITIILIILLTIISYNGLTSLLSVIATFLSTIGLWQKNSKVYKIIGFIVGILWLLYNVSIMSIMGIILETILILATVSGFIREKRKC